MNKLTKKQIAETEAFVDWLLGEGFRVFRVETIPYEMDGELCGIDLNFKVAYGGMVADLDNYYSWNLITDEYCWPWIAGNIRDQLANEYPVFRLNLMTDTCGWAADGPLSEMYSKQPEGSAK